MTRIERNTTAMDVDGDTFRRAMRALAGAVSVVTTGKSPARVGFTASSVTSLSAQPPTLLVCVNRAAGSHDAIIANGRFVVNLLADAQSDLSDRFAGRDGLHGEARFEGLSWSALATGAPALDGALANIDLELEEAIERHTHAILIGRIKAVRLGGDVHPLLYWQGGYRTVERPG